MRYSPTVKLGTQGGCAAVEGGMERDPKGNWVRFDLIESLLEALEFYTDDEEWYRALEERGGGIAIPKRYAEDQGATAKQALAWYRSLIDGEGI
jgi:hypothetical protein